MITNKMSYIKQKFYKYKLNKLFSFWPLFISIIMIMCIVYICLFICNLPKPTKNPSGSLNIEKETVHDADISDIRTSDGNILRQLSDDYLLQTDEGVVYIAVVARDDKKEDVIVMIKSALIFASQFMLHIIIFATENLIISINEKVLSWQTTSKQIFYFTILEPNLFDDEWKELFIPRVSMKLFLPNILPYLDAVLYLEPETIFLSDPYIIWSKLSSFNETQMAAFVNEGQLSYLYKGKTSLPIYGDYGINDAIILMNLTRMRKFNWTDLVVATYKSYRFKLQHGDQDLLNIILSYIPETVKLLPCLYNFRIFNCGLDDFCDPRGVTINNGSMLQQFGGIVLLNHNLKLHKYDNVTAFFIIRIAILNYELGYEGYPVSLQLQVLEMYKYASPCRIIFQEFANNLSSSWSLQLINKVILINFE